MEGTITKVLHVSGVVIHGNVGEEFSFPLFFSSVAKEGELLIPKVSLYQNRIIRIVKLRPLEYRGDIRKKRRKRAHVLFIVYQAVSISSIIVCAPIPGGSVSEKT